MWVRFPPLLLEKGSVVMMDHYIPVLMERCEHLLTEEQVEHIKHAMASYAIAAVMDTSVVDEAVKICNCHKDGG